MPFLYSLPSPSLEKLKSVSSEAPDIWVAITILFTATTYFFDYGSNIATAWKYYILEYHNESTDVAIKSEGKSSEFPGIFPGIIAIMVIAHIANAIIFYLHLDKSREALKSAYLLPVIYLRKLSLLVWRTGYLKGVRELRSNEMDAIYNIVTAALETGPQLILQFHVFAELGYLSRKETKAPTVLILSLAASFVSGTYNGGLAMATASEKSTLLGRTSMGIAGGLHIFSALLVRCIAFELITEEGFYHSSSPFRYYYFYLILVLLVPCTAFWILLKPSKEHECETKHKTILKCISYSYVSITLGPIYPITAHARKTKQDNKQYRARLLRASLTHFLLDVLIIFFVCGVHGRAWLTPCYLEWSREKDRRIHKRMFKQKFMSCLCFKALLIFCLIFYVGTLCAFLVLDVYMENRLEREESFDVALDSPSLDKDSVLTVV